MREITGVEVLDEYRLRPTFDNHACGVVGLSDLAGKGVFAPWTDYAVFRDVRIGESGELVWPNGADICPNSLYMEATGRSVSHDVSIASVSGDA